MPIAISFTVETDARLPSGESLDDAIERTDRESDGYASDFMINCAHPDHSHDVLEGTWPERVRGIRGNAPRRSTRSSTRASISTPGTPPSSARRLSGCESDCRA